MSGISIIAFCRAKVKGSGKEKAARKGGLFQSLSDNGVSVFKAFFSGGIGDNKITADHGSIGVFCIHPACDHILAVSQMSHGGVRLLAEFGGGWGFQVALYNHLCTAKSIYVGMAGVIDR